MFNNSITAQNARILNSALSFLMKNNFSLINLLIRVKKFNFQLKRNNSPFKNLGSFLFRVEIESLDLMLLFSLGFELIWFKLSFKLFELFFLGNFLLFFVSNCLM